MLDRKIELSPEVRFQEVRGETVLLDQLACCGRNRSPGAFYIGASPGFGEPGELGLEAHAWLKCGDLLITGEAGHAR